MTARKLRPQNNEEQKEEGIQYERVASAAAPSRRPLHASVGRHEPEKAVVCLDHRR